MKKYLFLATAAIAALASCTSDDFVGDKTAVTSQNENGAIIFGTGVDATTRADKTGAEAAEALNKNFVVEGIKTVTPPAVEVFDNYNVNWNENTADKTLSNTANWEYVGQSILSGKTAISEQSIKYWDYAATQYDFWAYSLGGGSATVSTLAHNATLGTSAYTIQGTKDNLAKVYISDLQTTYAASENVTGKPVMGDQVTLKFRSLMSKVRIGLYETIPGYSVKNVSFYPSNNGTATNTAALYASEGEFAPASGTSTYTVTFPTRGKSNASNADYNRAHVSYTTTDTKDSKIEFGTLSYGARHKNETEGNSWLRINSAEPTWAVETGATAGDYSIVMPFEDGTVLTLKVDYTLESIDGSGETITVHGATALIPSQYTRWKPNYAYTYLFKISDNTNGLTNPSVSNKTGLYPITFDAVVIDSEDGTQETVTTVSTPSITTYSINSKVTTNNEYTTGDDIYVTATEDGTLKDLKNYGSTLYKVTKTGQTEFTEAEVLDALNTYKSNTSGTYVGRNDIMLTPVTSGLDLTKTEIPLVDGNKITGLSAGTVALIDKDKLDAGNTYAFVYKTNDVSTVGSAKYEAVTLAANDSSAPNYFKDTTGSEAAEVKDAAQTVYDRYYVVEGVNYAIKVIKIKTE